MSEALDPKQYAEEELKLKKRARRRLVGATVLVLAAVVFLPWALQNEPKPVNQDIEVSIPSQDKDGFRPKVIPVPDAHSIKPTGEKPPVVAVEKPLEVVPPGKKEPPLATDKPVVTAEKDTKSEKATEPAKVEPKADKPKEPPKAEAKADKPKESTKVEPKADKPKEPAKAEKDTKADKPKEAAKADKEHKADKPKEPTKADKEAKADKPKDAKTEKAEKTDKADRGYVIQVGAFSDPAKAKSTQAQIVSAGYKSYTESIETERGTVTRVRAGPFPSKEKAEAARAQLQLEGLSGKVVPR